MLGQLLMFVIAFALAVVIGTFSYFMFNVVMDIVEEHRQAKERDKAKKREQVDDISFTKQEYTDNYTYYS